MNWSFSQYLTFKECPRKWYFSYKLANVLSTKEPIKKEAFFLSKLQSIDAWRGNLVDKVISETIVPSIRLGSVISLDQALLDAKERLDNELLFAIEKRWREAGVKTSDKNYAALQDLEEESTQELLNQAWLDIENAIINFYDMKEIWDLMESANYLKPQKELRFHYYDNWITCKPDLILLFSDEEPLLIDWKVHKYGVKDYRRQLALYALALTESKFSKEYPMELAGVSPTEIRLREVQLLTKDVHKYDLADFDITEIKNLIGTSAREMKLVLADKDEDFSYLDVPVTEYAEKCQRCPFQTICWENSKWEQEIICRESKQISFL